MSENSNQTLTLNYFKSDKIKVFPSTYRYGRTITTTTGSGETVSTTTTFEAFDPEATLFSERNITNSFAPASGKRTYIINRSLDIDTNSVSVWPVGDFVYYAPSKLTAYFNLDGDNNPIMSAVQLKNPDISNAFLQKHTPPANMGWALAYRFIPGSGAGIKVIRDGIEVDITETAVVKQPQDFYIGLPSTGNITAFASGDSLKIDGTFYSEAERTAFIFEDVTMTLAETGWSTWTATAEKSDPVPALKLLIDGYYFEVAGDAVKDLDLTKTLFLAVTHTQEDATTGADLKLLSPVYTSSSLVSSMSNVSNTGSTMYLLDQQINPTAATDDTAEGDTGSGDTGDGTGTSGGESSGDTDTGNTVTDEWECVALAYYVLTADDTLDGIVDQLRVAYAGHPEYSIHYLLGDSQDAYLAYLAPAGEKFTEEINARIEGDNQLTYRLNCTNSLVFGEEYLDNKVGGFSWAEDPAVRRGANDQSIAEQDDLYTWTKEAIKQEAISVDDYIEANLACTETHYSYTPADDDVSIWTPVANRINDAVVEAKDEVAGQILNLLEGPVFSIVESNPTETELGDHPGRQKTTTLSLTMPWEEFDVGKYSYESEPIVKTASDFTYTYDISDYVGHLDNVEFVNNNLTFTWEAIANHDVVTIPRTAFVADADGNVFGNGLKYTTDGTDLGYLVSIDIDSEGYFASSDAAEETDYLQTTADGLSLSGLNKVFEKVVTGIDVHIVGVEDGDTGIDAKPVEVQDPKIGVAFGQIIDITLPKYALEETNAGEVVRRTEYEEAIGGLDQGLNTHSELIKANKGSSETHSGKIAALEAALGSSSGGVIGDISSITGQVAKNKEDIAKNADNISKNITAIKENKEAIAQNAADISELQSKKAFSKVNISGSPAKSITAGDHEGQITFKAGANVTLDLDENSNVIIAAKDTTYGVVGVKDGLMSAEDKTDLDTLKAHKDKTYLTNEALNGYAKSADVIAKDNINEDALSLGTDSKLTVNISSKSDNKLTLHTEDGETGLYVEPQDLTHTHETDSSLETSNNVISVAISKTDGNKLSLAEDGLYVASQTIDTSNLAAKSDLEALATKEELKSYAKSDEVVATVNAAKHKHPTDGSLNCNDDGNLTINISSKTDNLLKLLTENDETGLYVDGSTLATSDALTAIQAELAELKKLQSIEYQADGDYISAFSPLYQCNIGTLGCTATENSFILDGKGWLKSGALVFLHISKYIESESRSDELFSDIVQLVDGRYTYSINDLEIGQNCRYDASYSVSGTDSGVSKTCSLDFVWQTYAVQGVSNVDQNPTLTGIKDNGDYSVGFSVTSSPSLSAYQTDDALRDPGDWSESFLPVGQAAIVLNDIPLNNYTLKCPQDLYLEFTPPVEITTEDLFIITISGSFYCLKTQTILTFTGTQLQYNSGTWSPYVSSEVGD
jgi:hypothetical protein